LLAVLINYLPHTQRLGTPDPEQRQPRTAIERAEHHLVATSAPNPERQRALQLLRQHKHVLAQLGDIASAAERLEAITHRNRVHARGLDQDRGNDLEL
ncbi:hypothetical protein, partial [Mycobacterium marinum]